MSRCTEADVEEELCKSLERSRKRNFSPSLLRGDQAVDRLLAQELSASPLLKKSKLKFIHQLPVPDIQKPPHPGANTASPSPAGSPADNDRSFGTPTAATPTDKMTLTKEEFCEYMDRNVLTRMEKYEAGVQEVKKGLAQVEAKISANAGNINANSMCIADIRRELTELKKPQSTTYAMAASNGPQNAPSLVDDDPQYLLARRSVRLWPVAGTGEDLWRNAGHFVQVRLALQDIPESRIESVSRPDVPSGINAVDEALVVFKHPETRDTVVGSSGKLAACVDARGRPTAGVRMEVPRRLRPTFSTLYKFGQQLRARHGEGTRRHVKFDDDGRTLFLNVKLPGDTNWSKVSAEVVRRGLKAKQSVTDQELERRLDLLGPASLVSRPRTTSLSSSAMDTSGSTAAQWTGRASTSSAMD